MPAIGVLLELLSAAPQMLGFAQSTYNLFSNGTITEAQLTDLWQQAGVGVKGAIAQWDATKPNATPPAAVSAEPPPTIPPSTGASPPAEPAPATGA